MNRLHQHHEGFALPLVFFILLFTTIMILMLFGLTQTSFTLAVKDEKLNAAQSHALDGLIYFEDRLQRALSSSSGKLPPSADADDIRLALETLITPIIASDKLPEGAPFTFLEPLWEPVPEGRAVYMTLTSQGNDALPSRKQLTRTYIFSLAARPLFFTIAASTLTIKNDVVIDGNVYVGPLTEQNSDIGVLKIEYERDQKPSFFGVLTSPYPNFKLKSLPPPPTPPQKPPAFPDDGCQISPPDNYALRENCLNLAFDTAPVLQKRQVSFDYIPIRDNVTRANYNKNSLITQPFCEYDKNGRCIRLLDVNVERGKGQTFPQGIRVQNVRLDPHATLTVYGDLIIEGDLTIDEGATLYLPNGGRIWVAETASFNGKKGTPASIKSISDARWPDEGWIYIGKRAKLKNTESVGLTWYVQENLTVDEAFVTPEAIFYVAGSTRVNKIKKATDKSRIIIFSNGNIDEIKFDESSPDEPLTIDAYLYTNGNLSIKADKTSKIAINGGLFAKGTISLESKSGPKKPSKKKKDAIQKAQLSIVPNPELILNPPRGVEEMDLNKMTVKIIKTEIKTE